MRRRSVTKEEINAFRKGLSADYQLRDYTIDCGPKKLTITGPIGESTALKQARADAEAIHAASEELLHGRDGLAPTPESFGQAPYWGELWPCSLALATYFGHSVRMRSIDAVEINCGIGTAGLGAAAKGARVLLTDKSPDAVRFARLNALQNGFPHIQARQFDWKREQLKGHVGTLIFSDVLFDTDNFDHVFRMLHDNLTPGKTAFLAEPGRSVATSFFEELRKTDYRIRLDMERVQDAYSNNYYLVSVLRIKKD